MNFGLVVFLLVGSVVGSVRAQSAPETSTVTLRQCYDWALTRSEQLKIRAEDLEQSRQNARSAKAGIYPRLDWEFVQTWQDPAGVRRLEAQGFSGFVQKSQAESWLALRQPLFSGLKEFSAFSGFMRASDRDQLHLERAKRELFEQVAVVYYTVLEREVETRNSAEGLTLAQDRVKDLRDFLRLGKARSSEIYTADAHAAALRAALRRSRAQAASSREELSFLTGQDLRARPLDDANEETYKMISLDDFLVQGGRRTDVQALRQNVAASQSRVRYEKGSYWPSLDLLGRYFTQRANFMKEIDWDVALSLEVPIFRGGRTRADVSRATAASRQAQLALDELIRRVAYQVRRLHGEFTSALEESHALEESATSARKSYEALREEYKLGLVTNLDVLQALDLLLSQRRARDAARLDVSRLYVQLGVATETLP